MFVHRSVHPFIYLILILPFGVMGGYLSVAVAWQLRAAGVPVAEVAALIALSYIPHMWKFVWAPIADTTLSRKARYVIGCVLSALGIFAFGVYPATSSGIGVLSVVALIANFAATFVGMSVESLMAYQTPDAEKGRAGGWFQAGNLGGHGIGGGLGLWLAQTLNENWMSSAIIGGACLLCCLALLFIAEPVVTHRSTSILRSLKDVGLDVWQTARARMGAIALFLCFMPIGSGAASGLWSSVSADWHASANTVALVTGVLNGLVAAAGCVVGGWVCDRLDRTTVYVMYGVLQGLCAVLMAVSSRTESMYVVFTLLYAYITGLTYAGFSAFVLEAMGRGAAATKYNLFASLSNMPIAAMTAINGWAYGVWGASGMLFTEASVALAGLLVFLVVIRVFGNERQTGLSAPARMD